MSKEKISGDSKMLDNSGEETENERLGNNIKIIELSITIPRIQEA